MALMIDSISEQRLAKVNPQLAAKIRQLIAQMGSEGIIVRVSSGLRTCEEQDALYAQGRTTPGKIVTNARGGQSYHNFGLAVDCDPVNKDGTIDWNAEHPQWKRMEQVGIALGLESGATWKRIVDAPHFQLTGKWPAGSPSPVMMVAYRLGGLDRVWTEADLA